MATKYCPNCGDEFVATVETCPECEVELVEEPPAGVDSSKRGQVTYELHEWAVESRVMLESLLAGQDVPHAWEGTDLIVPAALESRVDGLVDQVDATTEPNLDPEAAKVAYDLDDWDDEQQTELIQALDSKGIPYDFDVDGSLVVLEADDAAVEAVFDELTVDGDDGADDDEAAAEPAAVEAAVEEAEPDDSEESDDGDDRPELDAQTVMSDLFVAADRLRRKAGDHEGVLTLVDRATDAERMRLPYGFDRRAWKEIVTQSVALRELIEDDEAKDADIEAHAAVLRGTLRPYV